MSTRSSSSKNLRVGEKRSISALSDESVITQGGTKRRHQDARAILVKQIIQFMSQLEHHMNLFGILGKEHEWFSSANTTLLGSSSHLITSILLHGDEPTNRNISAFTCKKLSVVIDIIRKHPISLPTYADLANDPVQRLHLTPEKGDSAANSLALILQSQNMILKLATALYPQHKPPPFEFGQRGGWWKTQEQSDSAILCHRPASKRPKLPLKIMHRAFYEFQKQATFSEDELEKFRGAAFSLAKSVTDPLKEEGKRAIRILEALTTIFPITSEYVWELEENVENKGRVDLIYKRVLPERYSERFSDEGETVKPPLYMNLIIIEVKLEEGHGGDAFMQLCRYFDIIVERNRRYCETGAPTFLVTISGMSLMCLFPWLLSLNLSSFRAKHQVLRWMGR